LFWAGKIAEEGNSFEAAATTAASYFKL